MQRFVIIILGLVLSLLLSAVDLPVSAQQVSGVTISPLRQEGEIEPGFVFSGEFLVKNSGSQARNILISAETFNVINPVYDYLFKGDTAEASWVSFSATSLSLSPDESAPIAFQVSVPNGTEPGGYYLAFFATNQSPVTTAGIASSERVTSLLYLTVSGDSSRTGRLVQLRSPVVTLGGETWSATVQNNGTLHYRSTYRSSVQSIFNQEVGFNEDSRLVLPGTVRLIEAPFVTPDIIGLYRTTYTISLGDSPEAKEVRWFFYAPPLQIILLAGIFVGLWVLLRRRRKS